MTITHLKHICNKKPNRCYSSLKLSGCSLRTWFEDLKNVFFLCTMLQIKLVDCWWLYFLSEKNYYICCSSSVILTANPCIKKILVVYKLDNRVIKEDRRKWQGKKKMKLIKLPLNPSYLSKLVLFGYFHILLILIKKLTLTQDTLYCTVRNSTKQYCIASHIL